MLDEKWAHGEAQSKHYPIVCRIQETIFQSGRNLHLCWLPSHMDISGNEIVDRLANNATKNIQKMSNRFTKSEIKSRIRKVSKQLWLQHWSATPPERNKLRKLTEDLSIISSPQINTCKYPAQIHVNTLPITHLVRVWRDAFPDWYFGHRAPEKLTPLGIIVVQLNDSFP